MASVAQDADDPGRTRAILVIDDHPLFCDALSMALRRGLDVGAVQTASTLGDGLRVLGSGLDVEAVALDLNLPDVSGLDGLLRVRAASPRTPVVVISGATDDRIVAQALRAGASGFIRKDAPAEALVSAMARVLEGDVYTPPGYAAPPDDQVEAPLDAVDRLTGLTPQQLRILGLVCEGKLNKQIAWDLGIAETTVKAHITAILRKLGVQSRTQAVLIAQHAGYGASSRPVGRSPDRAALRPTDRPDP